MTTLDQVLLLEEKVKSAVEKIRQLQAENDALRSRCAELTNALSSKSEQLETFESDKSLIENGLKNALDHLNSIEYSILEKGDQESFPFNEEPLPEQTENQNIEIEESIEEEVSEEETEDENVSNVFNSGFYPIETETVEEEPEAKTEIPVFNAFGGGLPPQENTFDSMEPVESSNEESEEKSESENPFAGFMAQINNSEEENNPDDELGFDIF